MFRSFDEYDDFDIENPMVIDSIWKKYPTDDDDEEIMFDVDIVIDTSKLNTEQENHLINAIEYESALRGELTVDCADEDLADEDGDKWNTIHIIGYVEENALDNIYDLICRYDVKFIREKVKEI